MADAKMLSVIRERIDSTMALHSAERVLDDAPASIEGKLYYPYHRYIANCMIPTLFGKKDVTIDCLVDAVHGLGATADRMSIDQVRVSAEASLEAMVELEEAESIARRVIAHRLGRRLRMIAPFEIHLEAQGLIHKGFWIAHSDRMRLMIDNTTGGMYPLATRAAVA